MTERKGPLESRPFPPVLEAHAVDEREPFAPRIHGYDVEGDLARHYRFTDAVYLALTGELPTEDQGRAFEVTLVHALPIGAGVAPTHAAILAAYCGAPPSGLLSTAAGTLAEGVAEAIERVLAGGPLPAEACATSDEEHASVARLRQALEGLLEVPLLAQSPRREIALVAALHACGLRTAPTLAAALTLARLPAVVAETARRNTTNFVREYPVNQPPFVYEG